MKKQPSQNSRIHLYADETEPEEFRSEMRQHDKGTSVIVILAVGLFFLFWLSLVLVVPYDQFRFSPAWVFEHVQQRFTQLYLFLFGGNTPFGITFYQYIAIILVGAALATTGAVFQGSFRNMLAGPSTMGVMSGGTMGCLAYLLLFTSSSTEVAYATADLTDYYNLTFFQTYQKEFCVLLGCLAGVALVLVVATVAGRGKLNATAMILSGTVLSSITSNIMMVVQYYMVLTDPTDTRIEALSDMMMGNFNSITSVRTLLLLGVPILICLVLVLLIRGRLNLLSLGEEEAASMGLNVRFYRYLMVAIGTILTAMVVAFCGRIGFLGFMIPLVGRKLVGPDMRKLVPAAMLLGAILLMVVFDVAYVTGLVSYLNMITSPIGAIVMIIALLRGRGDSEDAAFQARGPAGMAGR